MAKAKKPAQKQKPLPKKRLDVLLVERGLASSRELAQAMILAGEVWNNQTRLEKPGTRFAQDIPIEVRSRTPRFVSRGGEKLDHAVESFGVEVDGRSCLDVGSSTGGFTDCLLQRGAARVIAVDVGYGQMDAQLSQDPRVQLMERTNARYLTASSIQDADSLSLCVMDVSFISIDKLLPHLLGEFPKIQNWLFLFKPQFEVGREHIGKGGVVQSELATQQAITGFIDSCLKVGLKKINGPEASPLPGKKSGNVEFLIYFARSNGGEK